MKFYIFISGVLFFVSQICFASTPLSNASLNFLSVEDASGELMVKDDFINRLSPFDMSSRMKSGGAVKQSDFLDYLGSSAEE